MLIGSGGVNPMSNNGAGAPTAVVPFAPKSNAKSEAGDELDRAGQAILSALRQAVGASEAKYQQAVERTHQLSAQLRSAEDRVRELEAQVRHHATRAERAEKWLYQISLEIEQKFLEGAPASASRR
jgi:septal ring factor EnvC (AmiA/AmiB activator)